MPEAEELLLEADLALLRDAAREAGRIALGYFRKSPEVWMKSGNSPVSEADLAVNRYLHGQLMAARPDYGWISEETDEAQAVVVDRPVFVVDPIDGTRAFLDGASTWCVSIAVVRHGRPVAGVLECPARQEIYLAVKGGGARRNATPIRVGPPSDEPRVAGPKSMIQAMPETLRRQIRAHPYVPSLAYRIAMIAGNALDATFVKPHAHDWDLAAADLILEEAGGRILNAAGVQPSYAGADHRHGALVAGSGDLLLRLQRHMPS